MRPLKDRTCVGDYVLLKSQADLSLAAVAAGIEKLSKNDFMKLTNKPLKIVAHREASIDVHPIDGSQAETIPLFWVELR